MDLPLPVILASASPRRRELLSELIPDFEIVAANVDEEAFETSDPVQTAKILAAEKARAVAAVKPGYLVIGADTLVHMDGKIFGKPLSPADARQTLHALSDKMHTVTTGVCILTPGAEITFSVSTEVWFRSLSDREIVNYVETGEPMDKAGAYAIQGGAKVFVEHTAGSLSNVIGLPMDQLAGALKVIVEKMADFAFDD